jgi:hypothetical protein
MRHDAGCPRFQNERGWKRPLSGGAGKPASRNCRRWQAHARRS